MDCTWSFSGTMMVQASTGQCEAPGEPPHWWCSLNASHGMLDSQLSFECSFWERLFSEVMLLMAVMVSLGGFCLCMNKLTGSCLGGIMGPSCCFLKASWACWEWLKCPMSLLPAAVFNESIEKVDDYWCKVNLNGQHAVIESASPRALATGLIFKHFPTASCNVCAKQLMCHLDLPCCYMHVCCIVYHNAWHLKY